MNVSISNIFYIYVNFVVDCVASNNSRICLNMHIFNNNITYFLRLKIPRKIECVCIVASVVVDIRVSGDSSIYICIVGKMIVSQERDIDE